MRIYVAETCAARGSIGDKDLSPDQRYSVMRALRRVAMITKDANAVFLTSRRVARRHPKETFAIAKQMRED